MHGIGNPVPVWGRGFYLDNSDTPGSTYIQLDNLDLGPSFAIALWYKAYNFDSLWTSASKRNAEGSF